MKNYFKVYFKNFDYAMFAVYILLTGFGLVMIYSASQMTAITSDLQAPDFYYNKQVSAIRFSAILFLVAVIFPYKNYSKKLILVTIMIAAVVLEIWLLTKGGGAEDVGSKSWIYIGGRSFQPSEYFKVFIIIYFAGVFHNKSKRLNSIQNLRLNDVTFPISIWIAILLLVGMETDLGAVIIIFCIAMGLIFSSGLSGKVLLKFVAVTGGVGGALLGLMLLIFKDKIFTDSRLGRFTSYKNPFEYSSGSGHQVINGYYAIGNGGLEGLGLGQSIQKLGYLPHPHTDFIMAIIAEELGILGVILALGGIGFIVLKAFYIAATSKDVLARMLAAGIGTWLGIQTFINVGGVSGLLPLTGVTLPFISYGGTSTVLLSLSMGILMNLSIHEKMNKRTKRKGDVPS